MKAVVYDETSSIGSKDNHREYGDASAMREKQCSLGQLCSVAISNPDQLCSTTVEVDIADEDIGGIVKEQPCMILVAANIGISLISAICSESSDSDVIHGAKDKGFSQDTSFTMENKDHRIAFIDDAVKSFL